MMRWNPVASRDLGGLFARVTAVARFAIPGADLMISGRVLNGMMLSVSSVFLVLIFILQPGRILDALASMVLSIPALALNPDMSAILVRPEIVDMWIAAVVIVVVPTLGYWYSWRSSRSRAQDKSVYELGQWELASREFQRRWPAMGGIVVVLIMYLVTVVCPFIAPHHPNSFSDGAVTQFRPPFTRIQALVFRSPRIDPLEQVVNMESAVLPGLIQTLLDINAHLEDQRFSRLMFVDGYHVESSRVVATVGSEVVRIPISELVSPVQEQFAIAVTFPLGTDSYGRDLLSRIMYGSRISLTLGIIAVLLSVTLGTFVGLVAGYFGRWIDPTFMRLVDVLLSLPSLFFILIIISMFESVDVPRIVLVVGVLSATSWMGVARLVRSEVLSLKERDFVVAAHALGLGRMRILARHILPNTLSPVIVNATLRIGGIILIEAALSYLNLGVQQPTPSWGNIIFEGKDVLSSAWWISTFPGFAIVLTVVSFNLVGDGLRDALDPLVSAQE